MEGWLDGYCSGRSQTWEEQLGGIYFLTLGIFKGHCRHDIVSEVAVFNTVSFNGFIIELYGDLE